MDVYSNGKSQPMKSSERKFQYLEADEELQQMKAQLQNSPFHIQVIYPPPIDGKIIGYYEMFGLNPGASLKEIKEKYRYLVKKWHPDLFVENPQFQQKVEEKFKEINEAYKKLCLYSASKSFV
jgi:DnaJ-domain-containing protein 1